MTVAKKTKLLILAPRLGFGGAETLVKDVFINIDREKFDVRICIFDYGHEGGKESLFGELPQNKDEIAVLNKDKIGMLNFILALMKEIRRFRPNVIASWGAIYYCRIATLLTGFPYIVSQYNDAGVDYGKSLTLKQQIVNILGISERFFTRLDIGRIAISEAVREHISKKLGIPADTISLVYCGVDTNYFSPMPPDLELKASMKIPPNAKVVSMVAALRAIKNHKMFIRVARNVCLKRNDVYFLAVGPDWWSDLNEHDTNGNLLKNVEVYKSMAAEFGISDKVIFTGPSRKVREFLSITGVFIMTSFNEGLNDSVLEAMACGKPVIATAVGGMKESIIEGQCGYYVNSDDDHAMSGRILELLDDRSKLLSFGQHARQRAVNKFSLETMIRAKENIYQDRALGNWSLLNLFRTGFAFKQTTKEQVKQENQPR